MSPTDEPRSRRAGSLGWRVLVVLVLLKVSTVVVGVLAIARARGDVEREVCCGALAHIRALGAVLDGTLQDARRTVELAAQTWADAPGDARATQLLLRRLRRDVPIVETLSILDPDGKLVDGDPVPPDVDVGGNSFGGYIGDATFVPAGRRNPASSILGPAGREDAGQLHPGPRAGGRRPAHPGPAGRRTPASSIPDRGPE